MRVSSACLLPVASSVWRPRPGAFALDALNTQRQALSCILRVWTKKIAAAPVLAAAATKLLTRLRQG